MNLKIEIKKGNLFDNLNKEDIFLHSCNSRGVWGAGIARTFKQKFPYAYLQHCKMINNVGDSYILEDKGYKIACLITSKNYGFNVDRYDVILKNTYKSLLTLFNNLTTDTVIHSPKINSGLFNVPWKDTMEVILKASENIKYKINWIVWEL